jgi:hypothetical protein
VGGFIFKLIEGKRRCLLVEELRNSMRMRIEARKVGG